ncbi:MAG: DUF3343 domain-containing protein [Synergistaceae bacterium]|nr:DUF3343 domain-containing protein [Synergistaceae bacterium]
MMISFANASSAITADKLLSEAGIVAMVMPVPSAIQTGCGFCLRLSPKLLADAIKLIESNGVAYSGVFSRTEEQGVSAYRPLGQGTDAGGISVEK